MLLRSLFISFLLLFLACSSGQDHGKENSSTDTVTTAKENFPAGQVIDRIENRNDASQSYALYLPASYSAGKTYPVVYAFDPAGTGKLPVSLYKALAEKYGYILIGSNNIKNGLTWSETKTIADQLARDASTRFSIDTSRIYLLGFSGGGRVAHGIAVSSPSITGAISCGASAPAGGSKDPRKDHYFIALVGNRDLNYSEVKKYDLVDMAGHNVKHALVTFDGKHEWPPLEVMNEAFLWMELNEMRKHPAAKNEALIAASFSPLPLQLDSLLKSGHSYEAFLLAKKTINFYEGLANLSPFFDAYKSLSRDPEIDRRLKKEEATWKQEERLKQEYAKPAELESPEWWKKEVASIEKKIKTGKDRDESLMHARILEYLSLFMYSQVNSALSQNNFPAAERYARIYVTVDPDNPEAYYLSAVIAAMKSEGTQALAFLDAAVKHGFRDAGRLGSEQVFSTIRNSVEFRELEKKLQEADH